MKKKPNARRGPFKDQDHFQSASSCSSQKKCLSLTESVRKVLAYPKLKSDVSPKSSNKKTTRRGTLDGRSSTRKANGNKVQKRSTKRNSVKKEATDSDKDDHYVDYDMDYDDDDFTPNNDDPNDEDYIEKDEEDDDDDDDDDFIETNDDAEIFRLGYLQQRYSLRKFGG